MASRPETSARLFEADLPERQWRSFRAAGFAEAACGALFTGERPPCCGVPLGGLGTGCVDFDARGVYGYSSLFNPGSQHQAAAAWRVPRQVPAAEPILGLACGGRSWALASPQMLAGGQIEWCTDPQMAGPNKKEPPRTVIQAAPMAGVEAARRIEYWGHYPVADAEYELDGPIQVGVRAWAPFIPGDAAASNTPAAVVEVHLRNPGGETVSGTLAMSFPGPGAAAARSGEYARERLDEDFDGVLVAAASGVGYVLAVLGDEAAHFGAGLGRDGGAWSRIDRELPPPTCRQDGGRALWTDGSAAAAVDFGLAPAGEKVIRFLLAWYAPAVEGARWTWPERDHVQDAVLRHRWIGSDRAGRQHWFTQMYAARYGSAIEVARRVAAEHEDLLARVLAWQAAVYGDERYPVWLRDSLVNNLALMAEDSHWFQARPPLGDASFPEGAFALNESPRGCPHMSCIPCDFYGNLPVVLFFPELARSNLRLFMEYQLESGEIPFALGRIGELPDMATPEYYWQVSLNGTCYVVMVDRLWQRTGDEGVLAEFYESVKRCNTFTMGLRTGPGGPISMPEVGGMEWFEFGEWAGMCAHLGGLRLAQLRLVERMAEAVGDGEHAAECRTWFGDGSGAMEEEMWAGAYYLNFLDLAAGKRSDDVMGYQLDGEWTARHHGVGGVFRADRVPVALETIKRCNVGLCPEVGAANFARPDGAPLAPDSRVAHYGLHAMFPPELVMLALTYLYAGEADFGVDLLRRHWETLCLKQGHAWDLPNIVRGDTGERVFGTDYYQNMILWAAPAAIDGDDLAASVDEGSLVEKVLFAGQTGSE
ncbi:MAG: GH116 family glycosyl-hydrolase [Gemmatimonadota bacterium]